MHVYGAYPPPKATALDNPAEGFLVKGWAEDADEVVRNARVLLAPLRFGAGIKGKLVEAMINGTPNVTTPIGAEAMSGGLPWGGKIEDNAHDFAHTAVDLYADETQWQCCQKMGDRIIREVYDREPLADQLIQHIQLLRETINSHRMFNFTGSMLRHHHHRSTQFMSQWIEAKNQLADLRATANEPA